MEWANFWQIQDDTELVFENNLVLKEEVGGLKCCGRSVVIKADAFFREVTDLLNLINGEKDEGGIGEFLANLGWYGVNF